MVDEALTKGNESWTGGVKIDRALLESRRHELQRVKRRARRALADAEKEIGAIDRQLRRAPNADA
jgi:hypothetical protein